MKIAIVIEHFDATRGGAEHLAVWVAQELVKRGHEVHVVCHDVSSRISRYRQATLRASFDADRSRRAHAGAEVAHEGLHIHRLKGMRLNTALGFRLFGVRARQWCARHSPEVVHSLTVACPGDIYHAYPGVYAAMQAQAAESRPTRAAARLKKMILRLPGKQRTLLALERQAMGGGNGGKRKRGAGGAKRVVSLSGMMTKQFGEHFPGEVKKVVELATPRMDLNGVRRVTEGEEAGMRAWFRGLYRLGAEDRVALFVGHDFRRKGLRYAIEAVARTRGWKLLVVGLGKAREYIELAEELGIGDMNGAGARVLFVGPTREMGAVYAAADALLLPAFYEPSGLVVLEAFGHGLPVVSTEFLGAGELVREHAAGRIVASPRDVEALARALEELPAAGTEEQRAMAARARAASEGISPERYMESLLALYKQVRAG